MTEPSTEELLNQFSAYMNEADEGVFPELNIPVMKQTLTAIMTQFKNLPADESLMTDDHLHDIMVFMRHLRGNAKQVIVKKTATRAKRAAKTKLIMPERKALGALKMPTSPLPKESSTKTETASLASLLKKAAPVAKPSSLLAGLKKRES